MDPVEIVFPPHVATSLGLVVVAIVILWFVVIISMASGE